VILSVFCYTEFSYFAIVNSTLSRFHLSFCYSGLIYFATTLSHFINLSAIFDILSVIFEISIVLSHLLYSLVGDVWLGRSGSRLDLFDAWDRAVRGRAGAGVMRGCTYAHESVGRLARSVGPGDGSLVHHPR
jgi:hypothetical protein